MNYDVIIIGAGPGGVFSAYQLMKKRPDLKVGVFEGGNELVRRHCPIDGVIVQSCPASAVPVPSVTENTISPTISEGHSTSISEGKRR